MVSLSAGYVKIAKLSHLYYIHIMKALDAEELNLVES